MQGVPTNRGRSHEATTAKWILSCQERGQLWLKHTPSFILPGVDLDLLQKRGKNLASDIEKAQTIINSMSSAPADSCSGRWYDKDGKLMLVAFADHIIGEVCTFASVPHCYQLKFQIEHRHDAQHRCNGA
jgi:hypothetical protein